MDHLRRTRVGRHLEVVLIPMRVISFTMRWLRIGALRKVLDLDLDRTNLLDSLAPKGSSEGFLLANRADVDPPPSSKKILCHDIPASHVLIIIPACLIVISTGLLANNLGFGLNPFDEQCRSWSQTFPSYFFFVLVYHQLPSLAPTYLNKSFTRN